MADDDKKQADEKAAQPKPAAQKSLSDLESGSSKPADTKTPEKTDPKDTRPTADDGKIWIKVYSPYQVYYDSQAASISAVNETGPFDILGHHHKFLTLLVPCEIVIRNGDDEDDMQKIKIARGVMFVKEDRVTVFLDI